MTLNLFQATTNTESWTEDICEDAVILRQYAVPEAEKILLSINDVIEQAPFQHMQTAGGFTMSVMTTSCGTYGWISDLQGYRYSRKHLQTGKTWPAMPNSLLEFSQQAAEKAGFPNFQPDSCLINRYTPNAKMSLHQDRNEYDFSSPIVSLSLGVPATFLFGGLERSDRTQKIPLIHGDVVVWGGKARLYFHGVRPVKQDYHPLLGNYRYNITFRKAR